MTEIKRTQIRQKRFYSFVILLLLYAFSVGPVIAITESTEFGGNPYVETIPFLKSFYAPLRYVVGGSFLGSIMTDYIEFCVDQF